MSLAVGWLLALGCAAPHPEPISTLSIEVSESEVRLALRTQAETWVEAAPGIDLDGNGLFSRSEFEAARGLFSEHVSERLRVFAGPERVALRSELKRLELVDGAFLPDEWVEFDLLYFHEVGVRELELHDLLFSDSVPGHQSFVTASWAEEPASHFVLGNGRQEALLRSHGGRVASILSSFLRLGVEHILTGFDHLAFLLVLLVASSGLRGLFGVVTAFTAAHSLTLALAAMDLVRLPPRGVELVIALSIAYVAAENLWLRRRRSPWAEAFGFGLIHGLGFAGFLGEALQGEPRWKLALLGFNLGVEIGQVAFVTVAALLVWLVFDRGRRRASTEAWIPSPVARLVSAGVLALGLFWFVQRAAWIG